MFHYLDSVESVEVADSDDGFIVEDDGLGRQTHDERTLFPSEYAGPDGETEFGLAVVERIATAHGWSIRATDGILRRTYSGEVWLRWSYPRLVNFAPL